MNKSLYRITRRITTIIKKRFQSNPVVLRNLATSRNLYRVIKYLVPARKIGNQGSIFPLLVLMTTLNITVPGTSKFKKYYRPRDYVDQKKVGLQIRDMYIRRNNSAMRGLEPRQIRKKGKAISKHRSNKINIREQYRVMTPNEATLF